MSLEAFLLVMLIYSCTCALILWICSKLLP